MSLDWATLRSVSEMTDDMGVLSIYTTLDPRELAEPGSWPAPELRLRKELAQLREQAKEEGPREQWLAVTQRLEALRVDLERLVDPASSGQGRAMFAGVGSGELRTISLQVPLGDSVWRDHRAHLRPLVTAWSAAGPAGTRSVSAEEVRVVDLRFGLAQEVATLPYQNDIEQRELKGPAGGNPALAQQTAPQHDLYERREDDKLVRFLRGLGPRLAGFASDLSWDYLAVTGESSLVQAVVEGLPHTFGAQVVTLDHPVNSMPAPKLAHIVAPALHEARQQRNRGLAERARDAALSAGTGAYGLGETLDALQQGRVAHLLLAADGRWLGGRTGDGLLAPDGEVPPGAEESGLTAEPHLDERMIELALSNGAEVTMLDAEAAVPLSDVAGVGAILRW